ncbi:MAG TPA: ornithine carbamoyltransferase [Phycisphaerales bacterium]|nr:ornithine carbamoyltransferase [Phycisphaerales bacterium]
MTPATAQPYVPNAVLDHEPYARVSDLAGKDLLSLTQLTPACVRELLALAAKIKANRAAFTTQLAGKHGILIFEKASLRTRITFETGFTMLGGHAIYMDHSVQRLGEREAVKDYAKNLERWLHCIVARVYSQAIVEELAEHASIPVINALSEREHPCQGLADIMTLWELAPDFRVDGKRLRIAYVGDGNNVAHSLMHAAALCGCDMTVITPKKYEPLEAFVDEAGAIAKETGATLTVTNKLSAVEGHHAVYTDVWVSMGQADEAGKRLKVFSDYQIDGELMAAASRGLAASWGPAKFMHCLPARRGVEVTDEVMDAPSSIVYTQAENRLHAQNALLAAILGQVRN